MYRHKTIYLYVYAFDQDIYALLRNYFSARSIRRHGWKFIVYIATLRPEDSLSKELRQKLDLVREELWMHGVRSAIIERYY